MQKDRPNIVLIGMPGAGKSTVGRLLAERTGRPFMDTDLLIQAAAGRPLQEIVDRDGYLALRALEEQILLGISGHSLVIATGGSAAYSHRAMCHLSRGGFVVFLQATLETLQARIDNFTQRGLAKRADQNFADLYAEREPLYQRYAQALIPVDTLSPVQTCDRIVQELATCIPVAHP